METVKSADGTVIACERAGDGPVLIVSVGALCDRKTFVAPDGLKERFTVVTYDRRGRGDSGDTQPYSPRREYEDFAAVAAATGSVPPFVFGHSSGAALALRAAAAGVPVAGIVAYEAPFGNEDSPRPSTDPVRRLNELTGSGRGREAVIFWMAEVIRVPAQLVAQMDDAPWVTALEPLAPTLVYDLAITGGGLPAGELGQIAVPVLVLGGQRSPGWFKRSVAEQAAAIPGARLNTIEGYDHNAPPEVITPLLIDFFGADRN